MTMLLINLEKYTHLSQLSNKIVFEFVECSQLFRVLKI